MKTSSTFFMMLFMLFSLGLKANNLPIPVSANESITVTLFFPTEIKRVIQPAVNFKFEYEPNANMATLIARKGAASNLTVITECGSIFSFLLEYHAEVANFTYVLSAEQAIGKMKDSGTVQVSRTAQAKEVQNEKGKSASSQKTEAAIEPKMTSFNSGEKNTRSTSANFTLNADNQETSSVGKGSSLYEANREDYFEIFCENNYDQRPRLKKPFIAGLGITLQLKTIAADKQELYFIIEIDNSLETEFKTKELEFYVRSGQNNTPLAMTPLYTFNATDVIASKEKVNMVYVFKAFKLSPNQKMFIAMDEVGGKRRKTMLKVDSRTVNSAGH